MIYKKRLRGAHKASTTQTISQMENVLSRDVPDLLTLTRLRMSLREKLEVIKVLDKEIVEHVEEADIVEEIAENKQTYTMRKSIWHLSGLIELMTELISVPVLVTPATALLTTCDVATSFSGYSSDAGQSSGIQQ